MTRMGGAALKISAERPGSVRTLAARAWHRPAQVRSAPLAGLGRQPQHHLAGGAPRPMSRPHWRKQSPRARRCSTGCSGSLHSSARASKRSRLRMQSCGGAELSGGLKLGNRSGQGTSPELLNAALRHRARFWNLPLALARGAFGARMRDAPASGFTGERILGRLKFEPAAIWRIVGS